MAAKNNNSGTSVAEPTGQVAEWLKGLPPIEEDPSTYDGEERDEYPLGEGPDADDEGEEAEGDEGGEEESPSGRTRDEQGRFKKAEDEAAAKTDDAVSKTDTAEDPTALREKYLSTLSEDDQRAIAFAQALQQASDPIEFLAQQAISSNLKDALLEKLGVKPPTPEQQKQEQAEEFGLDYDPSPIEEALLPHMKQLQAFPESVAQIAAPIAEKAISEIYPYLDASNIESLIVAQQVQAIGEALGIELPPVDRKAILQELAGSSNLSYAQAVTKVIGDNFKKAAADYKQAKKPRPATPGNTSDALMVEDLPRDRDKYGIVDGKDIFRMINGVSPRKR